MFINFPNKTMIELNYKNTNQAASNGFDSLFEDNVNLTFLYFFVMVDISLGQEILNILIVDHVVFTQVMDCILEHGKQFSVFKDTVSVSIVLGECSINCAFDLVFSEVGHSDSGSQWLYLFYYVSCWFYV
jgi:hypothetical protein